LKQLSILRDARAVTASHHKGLLRQAISAGSTVHHSALARRREALQAIRSGVPLLRYWHTAVEWVSAAPA